jgi:hypothetical protein
VPIVLKSVSLNLLEPSGPVKACNGIALQRVLFKVQGKWENRVGETEVYANAN